ncbi:MULTISPECIES: TetR/AcrR family transcriptional regulator [unclassified Ruegeria]|uniref:TetR/AcrR family transcriptional regulator n=1 Tax=unclassified Ruegeria TaxID=2625375 RepID=UPI001488BD78|nr:MULTISPECIES: TetR/AcrR family transcriptional regulator [unclassified Ruegeria]NOD64793.1 TetR family transcriptional regulator [Ruegeria sp. HKCCD6109]
MKKSSNAFEVLSVFAQYGFRKVSMNDIAEAAGLSRQSIYNQFGSKEAVMEWAVRTVLTSMTNAALDVLSQSEGSPRDVLARAYQTWIGDHVAIWRGTPHGAEIMEFAIESASDAEMDYNAEFEKALSGYLVKANVVPTPEAAADLAFLLTTVSTGLLLKTTTSEQYAAGMTRATSVLLAHST